MRAIMITVVNKQRTKRTTHDSARALNSRCFGLRGCRVMTIAANTNSDGNDASVNTSCLYAASYSRRSTIPLEWAPRVVRKVDCLCALVAQHQPMKHLHEDASRMDTLYRDSDYITILQSLLACTNSFSREGTRATWCIACMMFCVATIVMLLQMFAASFTILLDIYWCFSFSTFFDLSLHFDLWLFLWSLSFFYYLSFDLCFFEVLITVSVGFLAFSLLIDLESSGVLRSRFFGFYSVSFGQFLRLLTIGASDWFTVASLIYFHFGLSSLCDYLCSLRISGIGWFGSATDLV